MAHSTRISFVIGVCCVAALACLGCTGASNSQQTAPPPTSNKAEPTKGPMEYRRDSSITANRQTSATYKPGAEHRVDIEVTVNKPRESGGPNTYIILEKVPSGWKVNGVSDGGSVKDGLIRWFINPSASKRLSYSMTPPKNTTGPQMMGGDVLFVIERKPHGSPIDGPTVLKQES